MLLSIGALSAKTGVKVPTIRYYEQIGLIAPPQRSEGNQRRYGTAALQRLGFIKHARELGFSIKAIEVLLELQDHPDTSCAQANEIAHQQLGDVRVRIASLRKLEAELVRIADGCQGDGVVGNCYVMASLADHGRCEHHN